jgi:hypothetical protein
VFTFIREKNAHVVKRATWNIKRQEERIEKAQKKRSEWKYEADKNKIPLKQRLDSIFDEFEGKNKHKNDQNSI